MRRSRSRERRPSDSQRTEYSTRRSPSRHRDSGYRRRSKSPTMSTTSTDHYERTRGRDTSSRHAKDDDSVRSSTRQNSADKGKGDKPGKGREGSKDERGSSSLLSTDKPKTTLWTPVNPSPSNTNPPPPPLQPPPPVPPAPAFLSNIPSEPLKNIPKLNPSPEEKQAIWIERIKSAFYPVILRSSTSCLLQTNIRFYSNSIRPHKA
jgi:hypothetical protein